MARRRRAEKRRVDPDPKFHSLMLARFINKTMHGGKKSTAQRIVYTALDIIENTEKKSGMDVFDQAIRNTSPLLEVKPRRVGGATYQVPPRGQVRPQPYNGNALAFDRLPGQDGPAHGPKTG